LLNRALGSYYLRATRLRGRMRFAGRVIAALLGIAILAMAVGRYA
jgi:hypothetical protein